MNQESMIEWFLLSCKEDSSLSLVPSEDVIYCDSVAVNDLVKFHYQNKPYTGEVLNFGGEDCFDALMAERDKIMKERKKEAKRLKSFHADQPRSAKLKGKEFIREFAVSTISGSKNKPKTEAPKEVSRPDPEKEEVNSLQKPCVVDSGDGDESDETRKVTSDSDNSEAGEVKKPLKRKPTSAGQQSEIGVDQPELNPNKYAGGKRKKNSEIEVELSLSDPIDATLKKKKMMSFRSKVDSDSSEDDALKPEEKKGEKKKKSESSDSSEVVTPKPKQEKLKGEKGKKKSKHEEESSLSDSSEDTILRKKKSFRSKLEVSDSSEADTPKEKMPKGPKESSKVKRSGSTSSESGDSDLDESCSAKEKRKKALKKAHVNDIKSLRLANSVPSTNKADLPGSSRRPCASPAVTNPIKKDIHPQPKMTKYREEGPGVVELFPKSGLFVTSDDLAVIKSCDSANTLARSAFKAVFERKYLLRCSLGGNVARGALRGTEHRPGLDESVVSLLLKFVTDRQTKKKWQPKVATSVVKTSIRSMLVELRAAERKRLRHQQQP